MSAVHSTANSLPLVETGFVCVSSSLEENSSSEIFSITTEPAFRNLVRPACECDNVSMQYTGRFRMHRRSAQSQMQK